MWVARSGIDTSGLCDALEQSRDEGVANLEQIASDEASVVGLSESECLSYLRDNLYFNFGVREQRGLELFRQHVVGLGLAPANASCT